MMKKTTVLLCLLGLASCAQDAAQTGMTPWQRAKAETASCPPNQRGTAVARNVCITDIENSTILQTVHYPDLLRREQAERAAIARQVDAGKISPERGKVLIRRQEADIAKTAKARDAQAANPGN